MEINLEELREAVALMREFERIAEKVAPMFQALKDSKGVIVPTVTDRFVSRGDVCKILKIVKNILHSVAQFDVVFAEADSDFASGTYR